MTTMACAIRTVRHREWRPLRERDSVVATPTTQVSHADEDVVNDSVQRMSLPQRPVVLPRGLRPT